MKPPKITPGWAAGGWELEGGHVPGSYRMLGIWALSGLAAIAATQVGAQVGDLHAGMYAGAGLGTAGILAGAAVYRRCERRFTLPDADPWTTPQTVPARLADHLPPGAVVALSGGVRGDEDDERDDDERLDPVPALDATPAFDATSGLVGGGWSA